LHVSILSTVGVYAILYLLQPRFLFCTKDGYNDYGFKERSSPVHLQTHHPLLKQNGEIKNPIFPEREYNTKHQRQISADTHHPSIKLG